MELRIASRRSALSIKQVEIAVEALRKFFPQIQPKLVLVSTKGDIYAELPPSKIGSKGIFEREVNLEVLKGNADLAIHSLKDVPTKISRDLILAAVLPRESNREALVSRKGFKLQDLPRGAILGTSSIRRQAALLWLRSDLRIKELRGNLDTRISKLQEGFCDGILVAEAGLIRLGMREYISQVFSPEEITPAACQGAIGIYARADRPDLLEILSKIDDPKTRLEIEIERKILSRLGGGCSIPLGVSASIIDDKLQLIASLYSQGGEERIMLKKEAKLEHRDEIVEQICEQLLDRGGHILSQMRSANAWEDE